MRMMMCNGTKFAALLLFIASLTAPAARAQNDPLDMSDGNNLYAALLACNSSTANGVAVQRCGMAMGYIDGIVDASPLHFPDGVTHGQVREIVEKFLADHPEMRHRPSIILINQSMPRDFRGSR